MPGGKGKEIVTFKKASLRAADWLVLHQRDNGTLPGTPEVVEGMYKGIWALHSAGHTGAAARAADYVESLVQRDGDIPSPREEQWFLDVHYLYANGYLTIGAHVLGRFGLSQRMMSFVRTMQNPVHGGFRSHGPGVPGDGRCDSVSTAISGLAALYTGQRDVATAAAAFLAELWHKQESLDVFQATMTADGVVGAGDDAVVVRTREPDQDWYFLGLPALFLTALHEATGDVDHLTLARELMDFLRDSCHEDAFVDPSCGKAGVAAAMLYRLTGDQRYRDLAVRVGTLLVDRQTTSGYWASDGRPGRTELVWSDLDMTAEYVLWLDLLHRNLTSGDRMAPSGGTAPS